jgi:hypothetical protein
MSVLTPKRALLVVLAVGIMFTNSVEASPSPRTFARLAFDQNAGVGVLFGGRGAFDGATGLTHASDETWVWNGTRWLQRFPLISPPARSVHSMTFDSARGRVVLFGGRQEPTEVEGLPSYLNDTWVWRNEQWTRINTTQAPSVRHYAGMAHDPVRDRVVLFGGAGPAPDGKGTQVLHDTWEFDGTTWTQVGAASDPPVAKPAIAWDAARGEMIMVGNLGDFSRVMYRYRTQSHTWERITPETMPTCVNEGLMVYRPSTRTLVWIGGVCPTDTPTLEQVFEWDGTDWTKAEGNQIARATGQAIAYDSVRHVTLVYGGATLFAAEPRSTTYTYRDQTWRFQFSTTKPAPRSLAVFVSDPTTGNIWLLGGLNESSSLYLTDFWGYRGGQWYPLRNLEGDPGPVCAAPLAAYDTHRARLVVACGGSTVHEWDGTSWKSFADVKKFPSERRFSALVYDETLRKAVLFGGYGTNYRNDTWTWDGVEWTEVKGDKPPNRGLMAMWYDPLQKKTILYGGIGRPNINQKVTRFSDMWEFNGTGWTKMNVADTPGQRFGPQIAVNPESGKLLLFGGLRAETVEGTTIRQFFANDTWEWDGAASRWTALAPMRAATARENGSMAWDPTIQRIVMFAGYNGGFFHSDIWTWTGQSWQPTVENPARRRATGQPSELSEPND